jgi:hypothetical protein
LSGAQEEIMTRNVRISLVMALWCALVAATGCDREAGQAGSNADTLSKSQPVTPASNQPKKGYRNACDLLTIEEVSAAAGIPVTARETSDADGTDQPANEANRMPSRSACWWEGPQEQPMLMVKGYWTEGKERWEIGVMARGMAMSMIQNQEGVALDSVVKVGPVPGLGDKAIFSPLLGSIVLKDDIMLEIMHPFLPRPEAHFRPLVTKMLSRL